MSILFLGKRKNFLEFRDGRQFNKLALLQREGKIFKNFVPKVGFVVELSKHSLGKTVGPAVKMSVSKPVSHVGVTGFQHPVVVPDPIFLLTQTQEDSGVGSSNWVLASHAGGPEGIFYSQLLATKPSLCLCI